MSNFQIGRRRTHVRYEYDGDGRFDQERWNSDDKRYWTRWLRREWKEELQERIKDHHANDKHDDLDKEERHTSDQRSHHSEW